MWWPPSVNYGKQHIDSSEMNPECAARLNASYPFWYMPK